MHFGLGRQQGGRDLLSCPYPRNVPSCHLVESGQIREALVWLVLKLMGIHQLQRFSRETF